MLSFNSTAIRHFAEYVTKNILYVKITLIVIILYASAKIYNNFWIFPKFNEVSAERSAIFAKKMGTMTMRGTIDILTSFAKINSQELWIHSMNLPDSNTINLKIRSFSSRAVEKYINQVAELGEFKIENMIIKNVLHEDVKEEEEEEEVVVPFAARLFLDMNGGGESEEEEGKNNAEEDAFFVYETEVNIFAESR